MSIRIALAGNPNCGKTTLFNALTGATQYVGNWPGVTVEKKEGKLKKHKDVIITDLPGIYSLSPYTLEEVVARNYLLQDKPDAILNIVDATNLERNLYLTTQLVELGIPVVIALNMMDIIEKNGDRIDVKALSAKLGVKIVPISALRNKGITEVVEEAIQAAEKKTAAPFATFSAETEEALKKIEDLLNVPQAQRRWYAVKAFERDSKIKDAVSYDQDAVEKLIVAAEDAQDDDSESIVTNDRYAYISSILKDCYSKNQEGQMTISDKIDRVVTNRWLALPIFALIMFIVYYFSITTVGTKATDWVNDGAFGDGYFLLGIGRDAYDEAADEVAEPLAKKDAFVAAMTEAGIYDEETGEVTDVAAAQEITATAMISDGDTKETLGIWDVTYEDYLAVADTEEVDPADYGTWVPGIPTLVGNALDALNVADWLRSLILEGIVAGVGSVLGFLPQMLVFFLFLAFLEGCGYMARIAFIMDRIFRKFGLSGKSFIPMLIGSGCGVPGIMGSRTIENERDRRMTIMTTTFIPCSAKLPIIGLIAGAFFGGSAMVSTSAYFVGVAAIIVSGIMLKKTKMFAGDPAPFVMELPAYHWPTVSSILHSMWERGSSFVKKAGTVILLATVLVWFLSGFGFVDGSFGMVDMNDSILATIGNAIAWIFAPLGWGTWRAAVAAITGLIAKENVVGTFGVLYGNGELWKNLAADFAPLAGYSYLVFNLLCAPCFAAIGAIRREMNSPKWTLFAVGYQCVFAYAVALMIYQFGSAIAGNVNVFGLIFAGVVLVGMIYMLVRPYKEATTYGESAKVKA